MDLEELTSVMRELGVPVDPATRATLIRFVQRIEGREACFDAGRTVCPNVDCSWRSVCLGPARRAQGPLYRPEDEPGDAPADAGSRRRGPALRRFGGLTV